MLKNYLIMSLKVLRRRKFFTFVSLFGISFTLLVLSVVVTIVDHTIIPAGEESDANRMLYLTRMGMTGDNGSWLGLPGYGFLDRYTRDIPGVEEMTIFSNFDTGISYIDGDKIESSLCYTDTSYWRIFHFTFVEGAPFTDADDSEGRPVVVITESTRNKFFTSGESAVGRDIKLNSRLMKVVGVVQDVPPYRESTLNDIFLPIGTYPYPSIKEGLMGTASGVYLATDRSQFDAIKAEFAARLPLVEFTDSRYNRMIGRLRSKLEVFADNFVGNQGYEENPNPHQLAWVMIIGAMLLFMALPAINLVNINMSRIFERSSEIGVRKAFGASSRHLIGQFLVENIVLCMIGAAIGLVLAWTTLKVITAAGLIPDLGIYLNYRIFGGAVLMAVIFAVMSGLGPAWRMSRLKPVMALKGDSR
ncbi:MAG: FtsX-like permease family protein [bacterium]|nr:FtsX-like permease family protein [bacterium]